MGFFNRYPYSDFHELNADWLIHATNEVRQTANLINGKIAEIMQGWIDNGTIEQLINEELFSRYNIFYIPEDFGGVGDGNTDCTDAFDQACKAMAAGDIKILYIPAGKTYLIRSAIAIPEGCMLIGSGETSRIYFDETVTTYIGVGITNGGSNVTIANLRVDHRSEGQTDPTGARPGAIAIGNYHGAGKVTEYASTSNRQDAHGIVVDRIWCRGNYAIQVANAQFTVNDVTYIRTLEDVTVSRIYAPAAIVSMAPINGQLNNVHFTHIICDLLRLGAYSGYFGSNLIAEDFYCHTLHSRQKGAVVRDGVVDASGTTNNSGTLAVDLYCDNVLDNVKIIGGSSQYKTAIRARGADGMFRFLNCDISGFMILWNTGGTAVSPAYFSMCKLSQAQDPDETHSPQITGGAMGCIIDTTYMTLPASGFELWPSA